MLEGGLSFLAGLIAKIVTDALAKWLASRAERDAGRLGERAAANQETADAEARMRAANARPRDDAAVLERLRSGTG